MGIGVQWMVVIKQGMHIKPIEGRHYTMVLNLTKLIPHIIGGKAISR